MSKPELFPFLCQCLGRRWRGLCSLFDQAWLRALGWLFLATWLSFAVLVTTLRYVVLPGIGAYQQDIEQLASHAIGQPVKIGHIEARWQGINPDLRLKDFALLDSAGNTALTLSEVDAVLSWQSLLQGRLMLSLLAFEGPVLHIQRQPSGIITVAGIEAQTDGGDPGFADWLLRQRHVRIRNATLVWEDRLRGAPPLVLEDVQFGLDNEGRQHRLGLSAAPPETLAARLELRGEVEGDWGDLPDRLAGRAYVELDYADLAGWRPWIDYPVRLPQGRGALRIWGEQEDGETRLTSDVALEELRIQLADTLPELDLASLRGRLSGRYRPDHWTVATQRLELLTRSGVRVPPTDFRTTWQRHNNGTTQGEASSTQIDLNAVSQLANHLPLDATARDWLVSRQPSGRLSDIRASWTQGGGTLQRYTLKGSFTDLGLLARGSVPGARGISGNIDANETSGWLSLQGKGAQLSLPAIFPEPDIPLDELRAKASWKIERDGRAEVRLEKFDVSNADAVAKARGTYLYTGEGPGIVDLTAQISHGEGKAVWRYLPHAVNADTRQWLRQSLTAGRGYDGKLVLKGDLRHFPFRDPKTGIFSVTAKAAGARVDYATGWPLIDQIEADLHFGVGMKIQARRGKILGADLSQVVVEIPDLESTSEMLLIRGVAQGPTQEFLRFIAQSPVSEKIDRFTEGMKAGGNGRLDLAIDLPLRQVTQTRVKGDYRFQNNQVQAMAGLPPITQVNGRLQLSEKSVTAEDISGRLFGGPMKLRVKNEADKVLIQTSGQAHMNALREHFGGGVFDHLSGSSPWKADIQIRKRRLEMAVESNLIGVSSSLPEPLNKTAAVPLPLRLERTEPDNSREQYRVSLGKIARAQMIWREEGGTERFERGLVLLGPGEARLPDKGLGVQVNWPQLDGDAWKAVMNKDGNTTGGTGSAPALPALQQVQIKTSALRLFSRDFSQVDATLRPRDGGWQIGLAMREAQGDLFWRSSGDGLLEGRLKRLYLQPAAETTDSAGMQAINALPAMNFTVDDFHLGEKVLGQLEVRARNDKGAWHLENLSLKNADATLKGKGTWLNQGRHQTHLDFDLAVGDVGKFLTRLNYPDAIRRGQAKLNGALDWEGPLTSLHYPSLSGQMSIHADKGQFNKLEPGLGKLLGLISLQSLPRRLTLDFRDIFSDGLAFDSIDGKVVVKKGIMRTVDPLRISSTAAQIEMQGETDLKNETQNLSVVVRPEIGGAAAMGAALVNPVVGVATLLAHTVLRDPLNRLFSYQYQISGSWSDPQVDKTAVIEEKKP